MPGHAAVSTSIPLPPQSAPASRARARSDQPASDPFERFVAPEDEPRGKSARAAPARAEQTRGDRAAAPQRATDSLESSETEPGQAPQPKGSESAADILARVAERLAAKAGETGEDPDLSEEPAPDAQGVTDATGAPSVPPNPLVAAIADAARSADVAAADQTVAQATAEVVAVPPAGSAIAVAAIQGEIASADAQDKSAAASAAPAAAVAAAATSSVKTEAEAASVASSTPGASEADDAPADKQSDAGALAAPAARGQADRKSSVGSHAQGSAPEPAQTKGKPAEAAEASSAPTEESQRSAAAKPSAEHAEQRGAKAASTAAVSSADAAAAPTAPSSQPAPTLVADSLAAPGAFRLVEARPVGSAAAVEAKQDGSAAVPIAGLAVEITARALEGKRRFEIRLDPPELGRIDVRLDFGRDGQVTSRLVVERAETLDLLRRDSAGLERALESAGLRTPDSGLQFSLRDQSGQRFAGGDGAARPNLLIVPNEDVNVHEAVRRGYGVLRGLGSGLDIQV